MEIKTTVCPGKKEEQQKKIQVTKSISITNQSQIALQVEGVVGRTS